MWGELEDVPNNERLQTIDAEAVARWASESDERRAEFEACAMRKSKASRFPDPHCTAQGHVVPAGPLQLAMLDGLFPVEPSAVEEHQSQFGFARVVDQFERRRGWYTEERNGFPQTVEEELVCHGGRCCKRVLAGAAVEGDLDWGTPKENARDMLNYIRLVLRHAQHQKALTGPARVMDPLDLLRFDCASLGKVLLFVVVLPQNQPFHNYEATFLEMIPGETATVCGGSPSAVRPTLLRFVTGRQFGAR